MSNSVEFHVGKCDEEGESRGFASIGLFTMIALIVLIVAGGNTYKEIHESTQVVNALEANAETFCKKTYPVDQGYTKVKSSYTAEQPHGVICTYTTEKVKGKTSFHPFFPEGQK